MTEAVLLAHRPPCPQQRAADRAGARDGRRWRWREVLPPAVVLAAAVAAGWIAYGQFLQAPRQLWTDVIHDRNAHYHLGLSFTLDLRQGDLRNLLHDFDSARVWGPLYGLLQAAVLLVGGMDYRLAVLPSLAAWAGAAVFGFLAARRLVPAGGNLAGLVTAVFILGSPAHHAYATDIMIESLGACLSLLVVYLYLVAVQEGSPWPGRLLGLALTALFTLKYNYWLLVVLAVAAAEATTHRGAARRLLAAVREGAGPRGWLMPQLRQPLNYVIALLVALALVILITGGTVLHFGSQRVSVTTPHTPLYAAYLLLFARAAVWWLRKGRAWAAQLDPRVRRLIGWHVWPVAVWFLWPKRLGYFLWYLGPTHGKPDQKPTFLEAGARYVRWFLEDYHVGLEAMLAALGLAAVAVLGRRRLRPGAVVLWWFLLIAVGLTCRHPNQKSRFLHSWVAGVWVAAGAGLALAARGRPGARGGRLRPWLAAAGVAGLGLVHYPSVLARGHAPEGGPRLGLPCALDVTDTYLPHLAGSRRAAILSNLPVRYWAEWTYLEHYARHHRVETDIKGYGNDPAASRSLVEQWLRTTACDTIIYIDVPRESTFHRRVPYPDFAPLREALTAQTEFPLVRRWHFPESRCSVTVWSRVPDLARPSAPADGPVDAVR